MTIGNRIRFYRKERGFTQSELAEMIGVSVQAISKWETDAGMPDISQIVPLASFLGISTDCLFGIGANETDDRQSLDEAVNEAHETGIYFSYENNADYKSYELYRDHLKKYPLDWRAKHRCAASIYGFLDDSGHGNMFIIPEEQVNMLYSEAIFHLNGILNYCKDATRLIEAKELLIYLYLYKNDFEKAETTAEGLPAIDNIQNRCLMEIFDRKKDYNKCLEISNDICDINIRNYLEGLWLRARRISILGNIRKEEAISAWRDLKKIAKINHEIFHTRDTAYFVRLSLYMLSNDYIAISEFDNALDVIEEYTDVLISQYNEFKEEGDHSAAKEMKSRFSSFLDFSYSRCFPTNDNIIAKDLRFIKCRERLEAIN